MTTINLHGKVLKLNILVNVLVFFSTSSLNSNGRENFRVGLPYKLMMEHYMQEPLASCWLTAAHVAMNPVLTVGKGHGPAGRSYDLQQKSENLTWDRGREIFLRFDMLFQLPVIKKSLGVQTLIPWERRHTNVFFGAKAELEKWPVFNYNQYMHCKLDYKNLHYFLTKECSLWKIGCVCGPKGRRVAHCPLTENGRYFCSFLRGC